MKRVPNRHTLSFMCIQGFIWSGIAFYYPFFVPFLKNAGYDEVDIGIITSAMCFVGIVGPILWGAVLDRRKSAKALIIVNILAGCAVMQLVPAAVRNYGLLLCLLTVVNLTVLPMTTTLDGWIMRLKGHGVPINYGLARGSGSLAYAFSSTIAGLAIARFGLNSMFPLVLAVECVTVLFILLARSNPSTEEDSIPVDAAAGLEAPLHRNRPFIVFVALSTLLYVGVCSANNFFWILLENAGGKPADMGPAMGVCALSEFPAMLLSSRLLRKYGDTTLLVVAMGFYAVRIFLFFAMRSAGGLVLAQLTNSLSYGLFLPVSVHYISRITPGRSRATALSIASSLYMGAGGILGNFAGGFFIKSFGIRALYGGGAALALAVTAVFGAVLFFQARRGPSPLNSQT